MPNTDRQRRPIMKAKSINPVLMDADDYIHPTLLRAVNRRQILESIGGFAGLMLLTSCGKNVD